MKPSASTPLTPHQSPASSISYEAEELLMNLYAQLWNVRADAEHGRYGRATTHAEAAIAIAAELNETLARLHLTVGVDRVASMSLE